MNKDSAMNNLKCAFPEKYLAGVQNVFHNPKTVETIDLS